jgi:uncharacterized coiled-coil protein SlyX
MNTAERDRIMQQAHATLDRLRDLQPSEPRDTPDVLKEWQRNKPQAESAPRKRGLDTAPVDWDAIINTRIATMKDFVMEVIGQALRESFEIERAAYRNALNSRDQKINQLETELAKQAATIARLEARVIKNEIDGDRDRRNKLVDVSPQLKVVN